MVGYIHPYERMSLSMNTGRIALDVINNYHGNPNNPRNSQVVKDRVEHCLSEMNCCKEVAQIFCWTCEQELAENGIPPGLTVDYRVRESPFTSAWKKEGDTLGYDTQYSMNKDLPKALEKHLKSQLHKCCILAKKTRESRVFRVHN
eukprot:g3250.t1